MPRAAHTRLLLAAVGGLVVALGCQAQPRMGGLNPFYKPELTTFETPKKRLEKLEQVAKSSSGLDDAQRETKARELAATLAGEPDALLRQRTLEAIATLNTTLSGRALLAGLSDEDAHVRRRCCQLLGRIPAEGQAAPLLQLAESDPSFDVRVAAVEALGASGADPAMLLAALEDPNPAMQLAGVEAMKRVTGRDLGGDVAAYRAIAQGEPLPATAEERTAVANAIGEWLPFVK